MIENIKMSNIINSIIVMTALGFIFAIILSWASKKFKVEEKKVDLNKLKQIIQVLPKINCGRCGYSGCGAFAKAVLEGNAPVDGCVVGKEEVAKKIEMVLG